MQSIAHHRYNDGVPITTDENFPLRPKTLVSFFHPIFPATTTTRALLHRRRSLDVLCRTTLVFFMLCRVGACPPYRQK